MQFAIVDRENQITELRETEDIANLNTRRREMDMMPIEMYKRLILRYCEQTTDVKIRAFAELTL